MNVRGDHFAAGAYSFSRLSGALLTVNGNANFGETGGGASTTTLNSFSMTSGTFSVNGAMNAVISGSSVITTTGALTLNESSAVNLTGGSLNLAANIQHEMTSGTLNVNGGSLNLGANSSLAMFSPTSKLNFSGGYNVLNNALILAQGGGDVVGTSFIDVGNGGVGRLLVSGSGSTFTSQSSTSDWGRGSTGNALVTIQTGGAATVSGLRIGTVDAVANLEILGGSLTVNDTFEAGGGATVRQVQTTVQNSGTMTFNGTATFNNQADLNLVSGTLDFNQNATFNAGSRLDITGGTLDTTNQTLTINGGTLTRTTSGALSSGSALRVQAGGTATFSSFFDIGNGNSAGLTVTGAGSTLTAGGTTDWGFGSSGGAVVNIDNGGVANLNSLRIGNNNGSATVTVATGAQLRPNVLTVGGGSTARTVNLTINGGTVTMLDPNASNTFNDKAVLNLQAGTFDAKGNVTFFTGATANISGGTFLVGSGKTLTLQGGVINRTNPASTGLSPGETMAINSAGRFDSVGSVSVGEFGLGAITVDGTNSRFSTSTNLTLGGSSAGQVGTITTSNGGGFVVGDNATGFASNVVAIGDNDPIANNAGGRLSILNGSVVTHNGNVVLAPFTNTFGSIVVHGTGSRFAPSGNFFSQRGTSQISLEAGGRFEASFFALSEFESAQTTATVSGADSTLAVGTTLEVGRGGNATLNIQSAGKVTAANAVVGRNATGVGTIILSGTGSLLDVAGDLTVGSLGQGTVTLTDGALATIDAVFNVNVNTGSALRLDGGFLAWQGDREAEINTFLSAGVIELLDELLWTSAAGSSRISLDYFAPGEGAAAFAFTGNRYTDLDGYTLLTVAAFAGLPGDYNDSGSVEQGDLDLVLNNWGGPRPSGAGGFVANADGFATANVDQEELDAVLNNWGSSNAPSFEGSAVPEPATLALLGLSGLAMLRRRGA